MFWSPVVPALCTLALGSAAVSQTPQPVPLNRTEVVEPAAQLPAVGVRANQSAIALIGATHAG